MLLNYFALAVLLILVTAAVVIWVVLGAMPGRIARDRNHPHADAISVCGWWGVLTMGLLLPVLSQPIGRNGQALVDGGLVNNIPADVLVRNGCNFVIAVSVTANLEAEFAKNRPDTPTSEMSSASILNTVLRSYLVQNVNMNSIGVQPADVVIEPDVTRFGMTEFSRSDELAAVGKTAALKEIPKIGDLLRRIDADLFQSIGSGCNFGNKA